MGSAEHVGEGIYKPKEIVAKRINRNLYKFENKKLKRKLN